MSSKLIFSNLTWSDDGGIHWGKSIGEKFETSVSIEWNVNRADITGNLSDHPSIENVDQWNLLGETNGVMPYSIHLPLRLSSDVDQVGSEISAADGWTDLASYINAPLIRIGFSTDCEFQTEDCQNALRSILHYMVDMDRYVSIRMQPELQSVFPVILEGLEPESLKKIGAHIVHDEQCEATSELILPVISTEVIVGDMKLDQLQNCLNGLSIQAPFTIVRVL